MQARALFLIWGMLLTIFSHSLYSQDGKQQRYPIIENGLYGFIDEQGSRVVEPAYRSVGDFSDGFIPVRKEGLYGYIDSRGKEIIAPKFDMAFAFNNGRAKVFINGKPYFINRQGEILFEHDFVEMQDLDYRPCTIVKDAKDHMGVISYTGETLIETQYQSITPFYDVFLVHSLKHIPYGKKKNPQIGILDSQGNFVLPFGIVDDIDPLASGHFEIRYIEGADPEKGKTRAVIDLKGQVLFYPPSDDFYFDWDKIGFSEGYISFSEYFKDPVTKKSIGYDGLMHITGRKLWSDSAWTSIARVVNGKCFAKDKDYQWHLIDTTGQHLSDTIFRELYLPYSDDELSTNTQDFLYVQTDYGFGVMDWNGNWLEPTRAMDFEYSYVDRRGDYLIFSHTEEDDNGNYHSRVGFWHYPSKQLIKPRFKEFYPPISGLDLAYAVTEEDAGYVNSNFDFVWRAKSNSALPGPLNIDYMNRGYFYASSPYREDLAHLGGWGGSGNNFREIKDGDAYKQNEFHILVSESDTARFVRNVTAHLLQVVNNTDKTMYFDAQDSRLYMKIQAKDAAGTWRDIEYLPSSWCGNSYHQVYLAPHSYWNFEIPIYEGTLKTKLRAVLQYKTKAKQKSDKVLYSHEFDGSVNPGQFWFKRTYYPAGLMDPYFD